MTVVGVWHVSVRVVVTAGDSDVGLAIWDDRQRQQTIAAAGAAGTRLPTPGCRHRAADTGLPTLAPGGLARMAQSWVAKGARGDVANAGTY